MSECLARQDHWLQWSRAADGEAVDWDEIFEGYRATTDAPGCHFFEAFAKKYPQAKVILTMRDAQGWFESTQATILSPAAAQRFAGAPAEFNAMMHKLDWHPADESTHDSGKMIARITTHNERVKKAIPPSRLLVCELKRGWAPLCEFLGLAIPDAPFPHVNSTKDFQDMMASMAALDPSDVKRALDEQRSRN
jgi:hypothetical protein